MPQLGDVGNFEITQNTVKQVLRLGIAVNAILLPSLFQKLLYEKYAFKTSAYKRNVASFSFCGVVRFRTLLGDTSTNSEQ